LDEANTTITRTRTRTRTISGLNTHSLLLDVDLGEDDVGVLGLKLGEVGADKLAGAAPGCPVVDNDDLGARDLWVSIV